MGKLIRLTHVVAATAASTQDGDLDAETVRKLAGTFQRIRDELGTAVSSELLEELDRTILGDVEDTNREMIHTTHVQTYAWLRGLQETSQAGRDAQDVLEELAKAAAAAVDRDPGRPKVDKPGGYL